MTARDDFQNQLSKILAAAKAAGFTFEDVIPDEVLNHFHKMEELKVAKQCIKNLESQLEQLSLTNTELLSKLQAKGEGFEDWSEEFEITKVELQQANRRAQCWQQSYDNAVSRAEIYQQQLKERVQPHVVAHNDSVGKIKRLQTDLDQLQTINMKLNQENTTNVALLESLRTKYECEAKEMNTQLRTALKDLEELKAVQEATEAENEQVAETYNNIISLLESENDSAQRAIQHHSNMVRDADQLHSAINSEISPLNAFFSQALSLMDAYHSLFQILLMPGAKKVPELPNFKAYLNAAGELLENYHTVHETMQNGGVTKDSVRMQLKEIARKAGNIYVSLEGISVSIDDLIKKDHLVCKKGKTFSIPW